MANKWDKLQDESDKAYEAFLEYIKMPLGERSQDAVAKKLSKSKPLITRWAAKYDWKDRASAFDTTKGQTVVEARIKEESKWEQRKAKLKIEHREKELLAADKMRQKAFDILDTLPIAKRTHKDDGTGVVTVINPASSTEYQAAVRMIAAASEIERAVLGLDIKDEGTISVSWRQSAKAAGINEAELLNSVTQVITAKLSGLS